MIKNVNQQNKQCTTPSSQQTYIKRFYRNQMQYNYKSDEKILKTLIHKNILPTDPNKIIKLIIYYNKFKTSNLVIRNNSSPSIGVLQKTNVIYKFKCPLGDCISDNNNILCWFNLNYPVKETYNAPFRHKFNSSAFKKNIHAQQHN